jgi:hypothetical protein
MIYVSYVVYIKPYPRFYAGVWLWLVTLALLANLGYGFFREAGVWLVLFKYTSSGAFSYLLGGAFFNKGATQTANRFSHGIYQKTCF